MLKQDRTLQRNILVDLWKGRTRLFWSWGNYGIPWGAEGRYWLWGWGLFTLSVYDGRLWALLVNVD